MLSNGLALGNPDWPEIIGSITITAAMSISDSPEQTPTSYLFYRCGESDTTHIDTAALPHEMFEF